MWRLSRTWLVDVSMLKWCALSLCTGCKCVGITILDLTIPTLIFPTLLDFRLRAEPEDAGGAEPHFKYEARHTVSGLPKLATAVLHDQLEACERACMLFSTQFAYIQLCCDGSPCWAHGEPPAQPAAPSPYACTYTHIHAGSTALPRWRRGGR